MPSSLCCSVSARIYQQKQHSWIYHCTITCVVAEINSIALLSPKMLQAFEWHGAFVKLKCVALNFNEAIPLLSVEAPKLTEKLRFWDCFEARKKLFTKEHERNLKDPFIKRNANFFLRANFYHFFPSFHVGECFIYSSNWNDLEKLKIKRSSTDSFTSEGSMQISLHSGSIVSVEG